MNTVMRRRQEQGQTLIIALLILGVLLVLGVVFAGIVNRGILQTGSAFRRTQSTDLAEAGVRFAHYQLQNSVLGADWRPSPTVLAIDPGGFTRDPDALYLRPAPVGPSFLRDRNGNLVPDLGGPDGLGPFSRVNFDRGRALIRVRYAAGQLSQFSGETQLRQPAKARNYTIIEAVGRPGRLNANDPTLLTTEAVRVQNYTSEANFREEFGKLGQQFARNPETRRLVAFAQIGLLESSWFITNKFRQSRPAEIGSLTDNLSIVPGNTVTDTQGNLGVTHEGTVVRVPTLLGGDIRDAGGNLIVQGTGSFFSNADVVVHGDVRTTLDPRIGDVFAVAGKIRPANGAAQLTVTRVDNTGTNVFTLGGGSLTSTNNAFTTVGGVVRDGVQTVDTQGFARSVSRREPPSFLVNDPATGINRYALLTRQSGRLLQTGPLIGRNTGTWGHGRGIYVDSRERGNLATEDDRREGDPSKSLLRDWFNPNNPDSVAWRGPFYIPVATYVELRHDGFRVIRDPRSQQRFWRREDGSPTGSAEIRYRILYPDRFARKYIINSIAHPDLIDLPYNNIPVAEVQNRGWEFNGLLFFEGDVRIRGVIPTFEQLTLISMGTIYIEGSIVKGVVDRNGQTLTTPSPAALMLMSKDYIAVNTTMFFGPAPGETVNPKRSDSLVNTPNPIELDLSERNTLTFQAQFLRNPVNPATGQPSGNPSTWETFANNYVQVSTGGGNTPIPTSLLLGHSADNGGPSFVRMGITPFPYLATGADPTNQTYVFGANAATDYNVEAGGLFANPLLATIYGLTNTSQTAFPRFETVSLPMVDSRYQLNSQRLIAGSPVPWGSPTFAVDDESRFTLQLDTPAAYTPQNYALARIGMQPFDVRIEAAMYAEEGSFVVIPGPPFNLNPEDTRDRFENNIGSLGSIEAAQLQRYRDFGSRAEAPFFGEPLHVRISINGAISENMPVGMAERSAWQRLWGWLPRHIGAAGNSANGQTRLPAQHVPNGWNIDFTDSAPVAGGNPRFAPNLVLAYDPMLALGSADGVNPLRRTPDGLWALPPMPRLPVSPTLAYFGEVNP